eukprot:SAG31_NODE_1174_length_9538_cov_3.152453_9_plen_91_part_00
MISAHRRACSSVFVLTRNAVLAAVICAADPIYIAMSMLQTHVPTCLSHPIVVFSQGALPEDHKPYPSLETRQLIAKTYLEEMVRMETPLL